MGFRVQGLGFRVWGVGFKVRAGDALIGVQDPRSYLEGQGTKHMGKSSGFRV